MLKEKDFSVGLYEGAITTIFWWLLSHLNHR